MNGTAFLNPYLDTIIALVLIYALLSVLVSILLEAWNNMVKERGVYLQRALFRMLDDPLNHNFGYLIYHHPMINGMRRDGNSLPHYLAPEIFSNALVDVVAELATKVSYEERADGSFTAVRNGYDVSVGGRFVKAVHQLRDSEFKRLLENMVDRHGGHENLNIDQLKAELQRWFSDHMDRTTGIYKQDQRSKLRLIGLAVALGLNVDSFHMVKVIYLDKDLRDRMVEQAEQVSDRYAEQRYLIADTALSTDQLLALVDMDLSAPNTDLDMRAVAADSLSKLDKNFARQADRVLSLVRSWQMPMGWSPTVPPISWWPSKGRYLEGIPQEFSLAEQEVLQYYDLRSKFSIWGVFKWGVGILATTLALSWGAPFWFETLNKVVNIRRSGVKPAPKND